MYNSRLRLSWVGWATRLHLCAAIEHMGCTSDAGGSVAPSIQSLVLLCRYWTDATLLCGPPAVSERSWCGTCDYEMVSVPAWNTFDITRQTSPPSDLAVKWDATPLINTYNTISPVSITLLISHIDHECSFFLHSSPWVHILSHCSLTVEPCVTIALAIWSDMRLDNINNIYFSFCCLRHPGWQDSFLYPLYVTTLHSTWMKVYTPLRWGALMPQQLQHCCSSNGAWYVFLLLEGKLARAL